LVYNVSKENNIKKFITIISILVSLLSPSYAQSTTQYDETKTGSVGIILHGSFAVIGISGELFLGRLGLGAQFSMLPLLVNNDFIFLYEPGGYVRFYFFDPQSTPYLMTGATFFSGFGEIQGTSFKIDKDIVNLNVGVGYNVFLGDNKGTRFSLEIGYRFVKISDVQFSFPHFNLALGGTF